MKPKCFLRERAFGNPQGWVLATSLSRVVFCVIRWVLESSKPPWRMADVVDEVLELASKLKVSFTHVNCSANVAADCLAKWGYRAFSRVPLCSIDCVAY